MSFPRKLGTYVLCVCVFSLYTTLFAIISLEKVGDIQHYILRDYVSPARDPCEHVWPISGVSGSHPDDDRILDQLACGHSLRNAYPSLHTHDGNATSNDSVTIYVEHSGGVPQGQTRFFSHGCSVNKCFIKHGHPRPGEHFDAFLGSGTHLDKRVTLGDSITIYYQLESPYHSSAPRQLNWSATYRRTSTIVTPYEKFVPFRNFTGLPKAPAHNYAEGKSKMVAMFVSNCNSHNGRLDYARELAKHITVDIYGRCGDHSCPRSDAKSCYRMLKKNYKFYLSFENSNCKDYITEKLFWNALG